MSEQFPAVSAVLPFLPQLSVMRVLIYSLEESYLQGFLPSFTSYFDIVNLK